MEVKEALLKRRSVRKFTDETVSKEDINELMHAAMSGPSACNKTPWEFYIISNEDALKEMQGTAHYSNIKAPLAIVVAGNLEKSLSGKYASFWIQDCSAATENILLRAVDLGLGAVWCGIHPQKKATKKVSKALDLPKHIIPLNIIYIGHPAESPESRDQYDDSKVHVINEAVSENHAKVNVQTSCCTFVDTFNPQYLSNNEYDNNPKYYDMLLEQWKSAVSVAGDVSNRRREMNKFFFSVLSLLVTAMTALHELLKNSLCIIIGISVVGIILCISWSNSIKSYAILNGVKYDIINDIEQKLPVNLFKREYDVIKRDMRYTKVVKNEKVLVFCFLALFMLALIISIGKGITG